MRSAVQVRAPRPEKDFLVQTSFYDAGVTQLVEFLPSKQAVAGSSPVSRSTSSTVTLEVLHRPLEDKRAVITYGNGGFLLSQQAFNGHLPSLFGKHLPRAPLPDKSVCYLA
jgi:hypothetical protein